MAAAGTSAWAQSAIKAGENPRKVAKEAFDASQPIIKRTPEMMNNALNASAPATQAGSNDRVQTGQIVGSDYGDMVGYTYLDLQSWAGPLTSIVRTPQNKVAVTWSYARQRRPTGAPMGRMAGYNEMVNGTWKWSAGIANPGDPADSLNYIARGPLNTNDGSAFAAARIGWPNLINNAGNGIGIAPYIFYPPAADPAQLSRLTNYIQNDLGTFDTLNRFTSGSVRREALFHMTASSGQYQYVVTSTTDTLNNPFIAATGVNDPLIVYRSNDVGRTWTTIQIPQINIANRIAGVKSANFAIDAHNNTVAVIANCLHAAPETGLSSILFKSTDAGENWTMKYIDKRTRADTFNTSDQFSISTDGAYSVTIDNGGVVHVAAGRGFQTIDSAGTSVSTFYQNGGINPVFARILYWNDSRPEGSGWAEMAGPVDIDRNRTITFPGTQDPKRPGSYPVAGVSYPNLAVDADNNVYCVYSAVVEGTEQLANPRVTRDIYVAASFDRGATWTNPINVAGRLAVVPGGGCFTYDDGTTGSGAYEDAYPNAIKRIGSDGIIHTMYMSDERAGMAETATTLCALAGYPVTTPACMQPNGMYYTNAITVSKIKAQFASAAFPTTACAGATLTIPFKVPSTTMCTMDAITPATVWTVQLDTAQSGQLFANPLSIGTYTGNTDGNITVTLPALNPGQNKFSQIRVVANNGNPGAIPPLYQATTGEYAIDINNGTPPALTIGYARTAGGQVITANANLCNSTSAQFRTGLNALVTEYVYTITPAEAGSIFRNTDDLNAANVTFNSTYAGPVTVTVKGRNGCGDGPETSLTFNLGGAVVTRPDNNTATTTATGGQWEYSTVPNGGFASLVPPVTGATLNLAGRDAGFYRYFAGCPSNVIAYNPLSVSRNVASNLNVYPNPARDFFFIEMAHEGVNGTANIEVYNHVGQVVKNSTVELLGEATTTRVDVPGLNKGVYFVRITSGDRSNTKRVVIE